ncbi:MAG: pilus assembly FimT family protein [Candidatus Acidiferrales bacterium]
MTCVKAGKSRGFSLLELMIVITILLIMSAMATPALVRAVRSYQMESAANQAKNMIMSARSEAMRRNVRICAVFDPTSGENRYGLDLNGPCNDANPTLDPGEPILVTPVTIDWWKGGTPAQPDSFNGLPAGYDAVNTEAPGDYRVTFSPRAVLVRSVGGGPWTTPARVQLFMLRRELGGADVDRILITVTPMGKVKLYRWDFAGNTWRPM